MSPGNTWVYRETDTRGALEKVKDDILMTRDLVPTEPKVQKLKFYAPSVGPLLSVHTDGNGGRAELIRFTPGN